jgi:hypothetical protein
LVTGRITNSTIISIQTEGTENTATNTVKNKTKKRENTILAQSN